MAYHETKDWLSSRSRVTRRFIRFGGFGFFAAIVVVCGQTLTWAGAGWGTANFLLGWVLVPIYVCAAAVAVSCAYYVLAYTARFDGKIKWGSVALSGAMVMATVATALAHSLPQLSTLVVSAPKEIRLQVYHRQFDHRRPRGKRVCRNNIRFGPLYAFKGGWCGVYLGKGGTHVFEGQGNALAMRLFAVQR